MALHRDDLLPDLAIGRLPAATVEEVRVMVKKIVAWENGEGGLIWDLSSVDTLAPQPRHDTKILHEPSRAPFRLTL